MLRNATFRQLSAFHTVAKLGSVSRAAGELHLTQPAVSIQLKLLEESAGAPLLQREGRGVRLNDAGRAFLACAQDILQRADAALQTARRAARGEVGELTLGFTESASFNAVVTELIRHPEVTRKPGASIGNLRGEIPSAEAA